MKIKVCIADDHPIVSQGLEYMLGNHPAIEVCGTSSDGDKLLESLKHQQPDVLLLDIQMPGRQGDELARIISNEYPAIAILALTNMDQAFHVRSMFASGAKGYLLKSADKFVLVDAIQCVSRGRQYIDPTLKEEMMYELLDENHNHSMATLTKREQEILDLIAAEKTSSEIAKILFLSLSTVENHRTNLFFKLGVKNAAGAVRKAIQIGLIR